MSTHLDEELIKKELAEANIIYSLFEYESDQQNNPGGWDVFIQIQNTGICVQPGIMEEDLKKLIDCMQKD